MWKFKGVVTREFVSLSVVTVFVAISSLADEAPAHGCDEHLVTNDVSADART